MSRKRVQNVLLVLGLVVLASVGSWIAGSRIQSPAEAAARTAPPTPSPILVPVEKRILTSNVVTRGTARFGLPQAISIMPSALKLGPGLIFTLPSRGAQIQEGDVLFIASGRPVFALHGTIPIYRDLTPGVTGEDVRQLESGLQRLGFKPGPMDAVYDAQTSQAVAAWYMSAGFEPFGPTDEQLANIRTLESELAIVQNEKQAADDAAAAAPLAVEAARAQAAYDLATADSSAKNAAQLAGEVAIQTQLDTQKAAEREALRLSKLADQLAKDLETARSKIGVQVPADELVFIPILPARIEGANAQTGDEAVGPILSITNNKLSIDSALPLDEAPLVKPGMVVLIDEPSLGLEATGLVAQIAETSGTNGVDGYHIYFEVLVDETPLALEGFSLRLTIPVESTEGAVTVVPLSALSMTADGTTRIQVDNDGILQPVAVQPGLSADGFVEVRPLEGSLTPGQMVVIGFESSP